MQCKLCRHDFEKLADSHILAEGFFRFMYSPGDNRALLSSDGKDRPKRIRIGYYEKLLYEECDNKLGRYDEYGIEVFLRRNTVPFPNTDQAYLIHNVDYAKLKMFLLTLLYRASITSRPEFSLINLGVQYENQLRDIIIKDNPGNDDDFPFYVTKFESGKLPSETINKAWMSPYSTKIDGINFSVFHLQNAYTIYIKVDKRPLDNIFNQLVMRGNGSLIVIRQKNYESSGEFKAFYNIMRQSTEKMK